MSRAPSAEPLEEVEAILGRLANTEGDLRPSPGAPPLPAIDVVLHGRDVAFAVEWKAAGDAANVGSALRELTKLERPYTAGAKPLVPIVAVPFMGETGRRLCAEAGVSWVDLSGNAWIDAPGRHVRILGHRNRFAARGRPANVFAPRSSRIIRTFLMGPNWTYTQADLVAATGVDKGRVSRVVRRLETMGLLERADATSVQITDPTLALRAWREAYDFEAHVVRRGYAHAPDPDTLIERIAKVSAETSTAYALTGLSAAWFLTRTVPFHLTTVFVRDAPTDAWLAAIGFREDPRGGNVWIVRPADERVFEGGRIVGGVHCVHPLQVYLDLKSHPERSVESAESVRRRFLDWKRV